jgi:hypothetical protein
MYVLQLQCHADPSHIWLQPKIYLMQISLLPTDGHYPGARGSRTTLKKLMASHNLDGVPEILLVSSYWLQTYERVCQRMAVST